jgi:hypothetical protein
MENWADLYLELSEIVNRKLKEIEWIDLWHEQVSYLTEELPFPSPSLFLSFDTIACNDKGKLIQDCDTQVDMYLFFETFSDTYHGSLNRGSAINFLKSLTNIHKTFHGKSGENFFEMRRVAVKREESGGAGNLYRISFACNVEDASAQEVVSKQTVNEVSIENSAPERPIPTDDEPLFSPELR